MSEDGRPRENKDMKFPGTWECVCVMGGGKWGGSSALK